jgi:hypothetical protein
VSKRGKITAGQVPLVGAGKHYFAQASARSTEGAIDACLPELQLGGGPTDPRVALSALLSWVGGPFR